MRKGTPIWTWGYWVPQSAPPKLLFYSFCSKSPENGLLWCLFFYARTATTHLHLPSAPQIDPQVAGNLIGRSNLTKVSKPPCPYILTLLLSARPPPPPLRLHHSRDLSEGPRLSQRLSQCGFSAFCWKSHGGMQSLQCF